MTSKTGVVRLVKEVVEEALKLKPEHMKHMDKASWLSYLITKGLEKDRTGINVDEETKSRIYKVRGEMESKDGKRRSIEDVINELLDYFEFYYTEGK